MLAFMQSLSQIRFMKKYGTDNIDQQIKKEKLFLGVTFC